MASFRMQERDLDLFILEELHGDSGFDEWFAKRIGLENFRFRSAEHSVSAKSNAKWGETDVLAFYSDETETVAVLIEDKIAAQFTERQAERYRERAADIVTLGKAHRCVIVLVAPSDYLDGVPADDAWDKMVKIEELRDWFAAVGNPHAAWRTSSLTDCIERVRRSRAVRNSDVLRFSEEFSKFLRAQPRGSFSHKPTDDKWGFTIETPHKPSHVQLAWKYGKRCVDLTFSGHNVGKANFVPSPVGTKRYLADGVNLKSDIYSIEVPMVDLSASLEEQAEVVAEVMAAVWRLLPLVPLVLNIQRS